MMSLLSPIFLQGPVDIAERLVALPEDGDVPFMPGWKWLFTPGHTPGHISLWHAQDKALIAGDAFITTRQESLYSVLLQKPELHGPTTYYTTVWSQAEMSVKNFQSLTQAPLSKDTTSDVESQCKKHFTFWPTIFARY